VTVASTAARTTTPPVPVVDSLAGFAARLDAGRRSGRSVGVVVGHIAEGHRIIGGIVWAIAVGRPLPVKAHRTVEQGAAVNARHFTAYGHAHGVPGGPAAGASVVKLMNPLDFIGTKEAAVAPHWRIRHGSVDRDTSLAVPVILATRLANTGADVDLWLPWGQGHGGDYDLDELFPWIGRICR